MRAVVTRVSSASVTIDGAVRGAIEKGYLVLLGVGPQDTEAVCDKLAEKICNLRVFEDENRKMNLNLEQVGGAFLAMKSVDTDDEIQRARSAIAQLGGKIGKIWDYAIPGTEVRHRVVIIRKERPTPAAYPRPFARIKKAPLG